jgi:hypothetical protein
MNGVRSRQSESGIALVTTLMMLMLLSALMIGFFASISADQRGGGIDRDQTQAYAAAHAGLEKLTTDLARLFDGDFTPTMAEIDALETRPPIIAGFDYLGEVGSPGYQIASRRMVDGQPSALDPVNGTPISSGSFQGLTGLITRYDLTATARSRGAEVRLRRSMQTIAVPVFQFGVFSEGDLNFSAGPTFNFGGRVHTNGNLFMAEGAGNTLTMADRVTAVGEVIRAELSNGWTSSASSGQVLIPMSAAAFRDLIFAEGSVVGGPGSAANEPAWTNLSIGTYNGFIRSGKTGARRLELPLVSTEVGGQSIDVIRRPLANEDVDNPLLLQQRYYPHASLRILLSDTAADITGLPGVSATAPVELSGDWNTAPPTGYGPVDLNHPPIALSPGPSVMSVRGNSSTTGTINVYAVDNYYKMPVLRVTGLVGGVSMAKTVTCTGRNANQFTGCVADSASAGMAVGATVQGTVKGQVIFASGGTTAIWGPTATAPGNTITVGTLAQNHTLPFAPTLVFVDGRPTTCLGYSSTGPFFHFCTGLVSAPTDGMPVRNGALARAGTTTIGGWIKIEKQDTPPAGTNFGTWTDVTMEILNLGIGDINTHINGASTHGKLCTDRWRDAVIRLQRLRDNGLTAGTTACGYDTVAVPPTASKWQSVTEPTNWWPNVLYDPREGNQRETLPRTDRTVQLGGVIHYVALDVNNLKKWLAGTTGTTGDLTWSQPGYLVYFSDRRNNRNAASLETGQYGWEDSINPAAAVFALNGTIDPGEDVNANGILEVYGGVPNYEGTYNTVPPDSAAPLNVNATPRTALGADQALVNRAILFRRALKLINGGIVAGVNSLPPSGLTVVSENPVYVQGNYNALADDVTGPSAPAAVIADAVTLLSNVWVDSRSLYTPNDHGGRVATNAGYRMALIGGKPLAFPRPDWATTADVGTDGGVHSFLRNIEQWAATLRYRGSFVSLYTSQQGTGMFRCCENIYGPPTTRIYSFDTNFLTPALLPPGTPMFRDINALTFRQILRPTE